MKVSQLMPLVLFAAAGIAGANPRGSASLDEAWHFLLGDAQGAQGPAFDDTSWKSVDVPHDWSMMEGEYSPKNTPSQAWLPTGVGWYRKTFDLPTGWVEGSDLLVEFEGVYMASRVWINGHELSARTNGFLGFQCDLTSRLIPRRNVLAVRVDNADPAGCRFYTGSGIYGHVRLLKVPRTRIVTWGGVFARTARLAPDGADILLNIDITRPADAPKTITARTRLLTPDGKTAGETSFSVDGTTATNKLLRVTAPRPWYPEDPFLYTLETSLLSDQELLDTVCEPFGIKTIRVDSERGFFLNGKPVKLKGVCEHTVTVPYGAAVPKAMYTWKLEQLKAMGANAVRGSHYPHAPDFYDVCDRLGLMVMDEAFDKWGNRASSTWERRDWDTEWKNDLRDFVLRDRNRACVVMWSIGNETGHSDTYGLTDFIHALDDTRPVTGGTVFYGVDVPGFNGPAGIPGMLENFRKKTPEKAVVITEEPHTLQTRGFYRVRTWWRDKGGKVFTFPPYGTTEIFSGGCARYRSSYDNCGVRMNARMAWRRTRDTPWICGEFRWTGYESLGEAQFMGAEFPKRSYNCGILDLAGFPKDHYYFYQSQWTDAPMVHLLPHWTHPHIKEGTQIPVVAYSNCEDVELFLNGKSQGRKPPGEMLDFVWNIPYQPGTLRAVGYRDGRPAALREEVTAGDPVRLKLETGGTDLTPGRTALAIVTLSARDAHGNVVPWAHDRVDIRTTGPVRTDGYENGDPLDGTPHRTPWRQLFYGWARGFFRPTQEDGPIEITAAAILGDRLFQEQTSVAMDVRRLMLRGNLPEASFAFHYTVDGSEPTPRSPRFTAPFTIRERTQVHALLLRDGVEFLRTQAIFEKGPEPTWDDPHFETSNGQAAVATAKTPFPGPFDKEVAGPWKEGNRTFVFRTDGVLVRVDHDKETAVAWWWYDFPDDPIEAEGRAGSGQLRWMNSGQPSELRLADQQARSLLITTDHQIRHFRR